MNFYPPGLRPNGKPLRVPLQRLTRAVPGYLAVGIALILANVLGVGWFCYLNMTAAIKADVREKHTYLVIDELGDLLSSVKDAETGQRGFIITGDRAYLEPYDASLAEIERHLDSLRRLTADDPRQQKRVAAIAPLVAAKLAGLKENIEIRESAGLQAGSEAVARGHGRELMDELRALAGEAEREERRLLQDRVAEKEAHTRETIRWVVIGATLGSVALLLMFVSLRGEFVRRRRVEIDLLAHQDQLTKLVDDRTNALRESERTARAVVDGLTAHIATVDERGCILAVNARWRDFAKQNDAELLGACEGGNYLAVCEEAAGHGDAEAAAIAAGIRDVLAGKIGEFVAEYPCHSPTEERWFIVRVTPFPGEGARRAVISHENISARVKAERAAREKETELGATDRRLAEIMHGMTEACFALDREWRFTFVNDRCESLFPLKRAGMLGRPIWEVFRKLVGTPMEKNYRRAMAERVPVSFEAFSPIAERWLDIRLFPSGDGLAAFFLDIHPRKQAEEENRRTHALLDTLLRTAPVGFCYLDRELRYVRINDRMAEMNGIPAAAHAGRHVSEIVPALADAMQEVTQRILATGEAVCGHEFSGETAAVPGVKRYWNESWYPVHDAGNQVIGFGAVVEEITERKRTEQALRDSEERYRDLFATLMEGFCIIEMIFDAHDRPIDYRFLEVNPAFQKQTGLQHAQGKLMRDLAPDHEARWFEIYGRIAMTGEPERFVNEARALGRWYDVSAYRLGGEDSRKVAILFNDVTEAKRVETALRESEAKYRQLVQALPVAVYTCDLEGRIALYNAAAVNLWGYEPKPVDDRWDVVHRLLTRDGHPLPAARYPIAMAIRQGKPIRDSELIVERHDGSRLDVLAFADPIRDSSGAVVGAVKVMVDVTALKAAEAALREKDEQLTLITGMTPVALTQCSRDWRYVFANQAYAEIVGLAPEHIVGRPIVEIIGEEGCAAIRPHVERVLRGEAVEYEQKVPFEDGGTRHLSVTYRPHKNDLGEVLGWFASITDITERRRLEHDVLEISAHEQRRIGQDLHDDLCQWLTGIDFLASALAKDLARKSPKDAASAVKIAEAIRQVNGRARALAHGLAPAVIELAGLTGALRELAINAAEMFRIRCHYDGPETVPVRDSVAALNLYRIAQEAIGNAVRHGKAQEICVLLQPGKDRVTMLIRDDGCGIPQPQPQSPGMGLRTMRYRAAMIGATLEIRPGASGGTEVACTLPREL